mgnify:CR=1 FL=1
MVGVAGRESVAAAELGSFGAGAAAGPEKALRSPGGLGVGQPLSAAKLGSFGAEAEGGARGEVAFRGKSPVSDDGSGFKLGERQLCETNPISGGRGWRCRGATRSLPVRFRRCVAVAH